MGIIMYIVFAIVCTYFSLRIFNSVSCHMDGKNIENGMLVAIAILGMLVPPGALLGSIIIWFFERPSGKWSSRPNTIFKKCGQRGES